MTDGDDENSWEIYAEITKQESSPNLARDHLNMAVMFAEKAKAIEDTYTTRTAMVESGLDQEIEGVGDVLNDPVTKKNEYRFYATSAVIAVSALVEAGINEVIHRGTTAGGTKSRLEIRNSAVLENLYEYAGINLFDNGTLTSTS